jgi:hypothetical protein
MKRFGHLNEYFQQTLLNMKSYKIELNHFLKALTDILTQYSILLDFFSNIKLF